VPGIVHVHIAEIVSLCASVNSSYNAAQRHLASKFSYFALKIIVLSIPLDPVVSTRRIFSCTRFGSLFYACLSGRYQSPERFDGIARSRHQQTVAYLKIGTAVRHDLTFATNESNDQHAHIGKPEAAHFPARYR
jgi:hypothetical protein